MKTSPLSIFVGDKEGAGGAEAGPLLPRQRYCSARIKKGM